MNFLLFIQEDFVLINRRSEFRTDHSYAHWHMSESKFYFFWSWKLCWFVCVHMCFFLNQKIMVSH